MRAALRIHISAEVKHALDAVGGFRTEHRGLVDVKAHMLMNKLQFVLHVTNSDDICFNFKKCVECLSKKGDYHANNVRWLDSAAFENIVAR
ncbi:hypothetical protein C0J52_08890 [Blattella germanica]|nr:hypothetical protein C0J52_08890 [Blattella germanica]